MHLYFFQNTKSLRFFGLVGAGEKSATQMSVNRVPKFKLLSSDPAGNEEVIRGQGTAGVEGQF